jgi:uncharacterized membrane protein YhaH (DUF805 family)
MSWLTIDPAVFSRHLLDPRGRCDRHGFFVLAVILIVLQLSLMGSLWLSGQPIDGAIFWMVNLPILWVGSMAAIKRMHDIGRSAWWIVAAFVFWVVTSFILSFLSVVIMGAEAMLAGKDSVSVAWVVLFAAVVLPAFGGLIWLHATPGEPMANRFGPVTDATGFSGPTVESAIDTRGPSDAVAHA